MTKDGRLLVAVPELGPNGGVQAFSRFLVRAAGESVGFDRLALFSRNETGERVGGMFPAAGAASGLGSLPRCLRSAAAGLALRHAAKSTSAVAVLCSHPHLAPAAVATGLPVVCTAHGIDAWSIRRRSVLAGLSGCARVLAVSRFTRDRLVEQIPDLSRRVSVFPNTYDAAAFTPGPPSAGLRDRFGLPPDAKVILTVARLARTERRKGYDRVVEALPRVLASFPSAFYLLAGGGTDADRVGRLAARLGVGERVRITGAVARDVLADLYRLADVFVMPSTKEGFGIVFLEAIACGAPAIGGDAGGTPDALGDGAYGRLVDPGDTAAIADAVVAELARGPAGRAETTNRLAPRISEAFGFPEFRERLAAHLAEVAPALIRGVDVAATRRDGGDA